MSNDDQHECFWRGTGDSRWKEGANGPTILLFRNERNEPDMHGVGSSRCESAAERIAAVTHSRLRPTISAAGGDRVHDVGSALRGRVGHLRATAPHDSVPSCLVGRFFFLSGVGRLFVGPS